jgi:dynein heavy chain
MKVMRVISDVKDVEHKCEGIVVRMKEMVNKLKKHGV